MDLRSFVDKIFPEEKQVNLLKAIVGNLYNFHSKLYFSKNFNYPKEEKPYVFALWHAHQCALYSLKNREKINIMISRSADGSIIAHAVEKLGFKTVRGSSQNKNVAWMNKGGSSATRELIHRIKNGESGAITIDGPRGPLHVVKKGILEIAKLSGASIVPLSCYSGDFGAVRFNTWDKFEYPIPGVQIVVVYGEPIPVPADADTETLENIRKQVEDKLIELYDYAKTNYKTLSKQKV